MIKTIVKGGRAFYKYGKEIFKTKKAAEAAKVAAEAPKAAKMGPKVKRVDKATEPKVPPTMGPKVKRVVPKKRATAKRDLAEEARLKALVKPNTSTSGAGRAAGATGAVALAASAAALNKNNSKKPAEKPIAAPVGPDDDFDATRYDRATRSPAPVEQGKPGMTRAEAEEAGLAEPESGFWQGMADVIAGGKGKGTVEYDYEDYDTEKKKGGMVYRMKGGKVGKATKRGTGRAIGGAQINYGKPMKESKSSYKSGGKVGMRGCGVAQRGFGKAMKGK